MKSAVVERCAGASPALLAPNADAVASAELQSRTMSFSVLVEAVGCPPQ
ncbi:hypothetical protein [Prochlorococcus marinus]|nr:hypothetical protein [Prochlorococcus marinus]